jgi:hypothetical protein
VPVRTIDSDAEVTVVVDGDLGAPATLVSMHSTLMAVAFTASAPIVVDLSSSTGSSAAIHRLLDRVGRVMAHRGLGFSIRIGAQPQLTH